jgi:putative N-acetylmannosamine-6-phosphate epimerase
MELTEKQIEILACDIAVRPRDAAGIAELLPYIQEVRVENEKLMASMSVDAKALVESFVNAERQCCTALSWQTINDDTQVQLLIGGTASQLKVVRSWFEGE